LTGDKADVPLTERDADVRLALGVLKEGVRTPRVIPVVSRAFVP